MIILNITTQVSHAAHEAWLKWFTEEHLPAIMRTGSFTHAQWVRVRELADEEGLTYAVQLYCPDWSALDAFRINELPRFRESEKKLWGNNIFSFESVMEVIN